MRKLYFALIVCLCLVTALSIPSFAAETTDLLTDSVLSMESGGSWEWEDGQLAAANQAFGDTCIMSEIYVEPGDHVVLEATGTVIQGNAWGIMLAEIDPSAPFLSWLCMNMDLSRPSTRLFGPGVGDPNEAELRNPNFTEGQPYTLALEITDENEFVCYFNGEEYGRRTNADWMGAYVGLMTWFSDATFSSYSMTKLGSGEKYEPAKIEMVIEEKPYDVRTIETAGTVDLLKADKFKQQVNGEFNWNGDKLVAPNANLGDCAYCTDVFVGPEDHVYIEVTANVTEGQAFGILMPRVSWETPLDNWMCMNMEIGRPSTRLFGPGFAKEVQLYSDDFTNNKPLTIGVEIDHGTFYLYSEGNLYGSIENTEWEGCYVGLMTWSGSVEFTSFKMSQVTGAEQYTVNPGEAAPAEEPAAEEPVEEPAAEEPAVEEPAAEEPAVEEPAVEEPPVVEEAVTSEPKAAEPISPNTFDVSLLWIALAAVSGTGIVIGRKKK